MLSNILKSTLYVAAACAILLAASTAANAQTATAQFDVTATVLDNCTVSAGALAFGNYTGAVANSTSTISVTCTNTTAYNVGLSAGASTDVTARHMTGPGTDVLNYALFSDTNRSVNWGDTGTDTVAGIGSGSAQSLTVYGQIPAGQLNVTPGSYTDTITATVTY